MQATRFRRLTIAALLLSSQAAVLAAQPTPPATLIKGCTVYPDPAAPPIKNGAVLLSGGTIQAVGTEEEVSAPTGAELVDCSGGAVAAAFWNSHVHFMEAKWVPAATLPAADLSRHLDDMLGRYGFAYVVDTGSDLSNTLALKRRIEAGEIEGPAILTAGFALVPPNGQPAYLDFPLPELTSPEQARAMISGNFDAGADAVKLMTVPATRRQPPPAMDIAVVRAATEEAHRRGKWAFAHPTNLTGVRLAIEGGVDVLLHPSFDGGPWTPELVAQMVEKKLALTPTLKLLSFEAAKDGGDWAPQATLASIAKIKTFVDAGGTLLFGTDVGYVTDYDPSDEYVLMSRAGLSVGQILASLTTAPAAKFGQSERTGRLAPGMDADLVILRADPATDVKAFARVRNLYRAGKLIYGKE